MSDPLNTFRRKYVGPTRKDGDTRRVRRFLWSPLTLQNERRWLCVAEVFQYYVAEGYTLTGYDYTPRGWHDWAWGDQVAGAMWVDDQCLGRELELVWHEGFGPKERTLTP